MPPPSSLEDESERDPTPIQSTEAISPRTKRLFDALRRLQDLDEQDDIPMSSTRVRDISRHEKQILWTKRELVEMETEVSRMARKSEVEKMVTKEDLRTEVCKMDEKLEDLNNKMDAIMRGPQQGTGQENTLPFPQYMSIAPHPSRR